MPKQVLAAGIVAALATLLTTAPTPAANASTVNAAAKNVVPIGGSQLKTSTSTDDEPPSVIALAPKITIDKELPAEEQAALKKRMAMLEELANRVKNRTIGLEELVEQLDKFKVTAVVVNQSNILFTAQPQIQGLHFSEIEPVLFVRHEPTAKKIVETLKASGQNLNEDESSWYHPLAA